MGAFPCRGDLDEDAFARGAEFFVEADEVAGFFDGGLGVEREAGVHLGGDAAGDDLEDFAAEGDEEVVDDLAVECGAGERGVAVVGDGFFEERLVVGVLDGLVDQGGVRRGVLRREGADGFKIAGIGDDCGELFELVEGVGHGFCDCGDFAERVAEKQSGIRIARAVPCAHESSGVCESMRCRPPARQQAAMQGFGEAAVDKKGGAGVRG